MCPSPDQLHSLKTISRVLQKLANGALFDAQREPSLFFLNKDFLIPAREGLMEWCERVIVRATTSVEDDGTGGAITRIEAVRRLLDNGEDGKTGETGKTGKIGETAGETRDKTEGGGGEGGCGSGEGEGEGDDGEVRGGGRLYKHSSSGYEDTGGDSPYSGGSAADAPFAEWDGVRTSSVEKLDKEEEQASRALHHVKLIDSAGAGRGSLTGSRCRAPGRTRARRTTRSAATPCRRRRPSAAYERSPCRRSAPVFAVGLKEGGVEIGLRKLRASKVLWQPGRVQVLEKWPSGGLSKCDQL